MSDHLKYIAHYPQQIRTQVEQLLAQGSLGHYLTSRYPTTHDVRSDSALRDLVEQYKRRYMKRAAPLSKVAYDPNIHLVKHALGTHTRISRVQGNKLKSKNEIRISRLFKDAPLGMLEMILVHELAHLKEANHDKAFYQLCQHMQPDYHQRELDTRLYLIELEANGPLYEASGT
ncbi:M48 family metallopeptidase [Aliagarivorans marinus]|uniref:M48 family metallopeptidase n=1 Tax=Aliagarivorans marinus TaxID=561965 RepID=UPI0003FFFFB9|nr:M48 family metallopeptidase [Aliagarivorans marinus]